jgi:hypothetical protein
MIRSNADDDVVIRGILDAECEGETEFLELFETLRDYRPHIFERLQNLLKPTHGATVF